MCELVTGKADRKNSLGVSVRTGRYHCWKCGSSDRIPHFDPADIDCARDMGAQDEGPQEISPPENYIALSSRDAQSSIACRPAYDYLLGPTPKCRGLDLDTVFDAEIGCCPTGRYQGRVVIPLFADDGAWLWYVARSWVKKAEKPYIYPSGNRVGLIYNHKLLHVETDEPVAVVEGVFDAISVGNAVAILGKPSEEQFWALASARRPLAIVQDGDAHTLGLSMMLRLRFEGARVGNIRLPPGLDPDELEQAALQQHMHECIGQDDSVLCTARVKVDL